MSNFISSDEFLLKILKDLSKFEQHTPNKFIFTANKIQYAHVILSHGNDDKLEIEIIGEKSQQYAMELNKAPADLFFHTLSVMQSSHATYIKRFQGY